MKKLLLAALIFSALTAVYGQKKPATVSMEKAIADASDELSLKVSVKTEVVIAAIKAPDSKVADFLTDELTSYLMRSGKFTVLERGNALNAVNAEQEFQMSGMVSDQSAVGIGKYLGAKVVITGTFDLYDGFNQLRLRAVDVQSSQLLAMPSSRVNPKDKVLASVVPKASKPQKIQEQTLENLNRGKDLYREKKYDEAISEFDEAIRREPKNAEAYANRGIVYANGKRDYDAGIADYTKAISIDGNNADYYFRRASAYTYKREQDRALNDLNQTIKLNPNNLGAYSLRGAIYQEKKNYDLAIADYTQVIRLANTKKDLESLLRLYSAYGSRGHIYSTFKRDYDKAIADYTEVLRIKNLIEGINVRSSDYASLGIAHIGRGKEYNDKGSYDRAVTEYDKAITALTEAIRLDPNNLSAYTERGKAYFGKKDYNRAIADYEVVLKVKPDDYFAKYGREDALKARGN